MNAHIVIGPEGSGTRLLTKILLSGGCIGDGGHDQRFDDSIPSADDVDNPVVWRRSVPHYGEEIMPDVDAMVEALDGFDVKILVAVRSPYPLGQVRGELPGSGLFGLGL